MNYELIIIIGIIFIAVLFTKIFGKLLKFTSYFLTILVLTLLIVSFYRPEIKEVFVSKVKNNIFGNYHILKNKISGEIGEVNLGNEITGSIVNQNISKRQK